MNSLKHIGAVIVLLVLLIGCDYINRKQDEQPLARVKDHYLYYSQIKNIIPSGISSTDSSILVKAYIDRWARQHLLMSGAQRNLTEEQQLEFDELVSQYKTDLFIKAYLDGLVIQTVDTLITNSEAEQIYEENKESFRLNEEILRLRYIGLAQSALNLNEVTERLKRFDSIDRIHLDSISMQFKSFALDDSLWVKAKDVREQIPVLNAESTQELLKISNFLELKDSINLYLIKVVDVRKQYDYAPLQYVMPTIEQMVLNKRKLELTKKLEKDILKDAIRTKDYEVYQ